MSQLLPFVKLLQKAELQEAIIKNMLTTVLLWIQRDLFQKSELKQVISTLEMLKQKNSPFSTFSKYDVDVDSFSEISKIRVNYRKKVEELRKLEKMEDQNINRNLQKSKEDLLEELKEIKIRRNKIIESFIDSVEVRLGRSLLELKEVDIKIDKLNTRL